jgi:hypothetical protein
MQRPDLRHISGNIREALEGCDRDTLLDILTFVFKEYLVEGPPPLLVHQTERVEDLQGLSFAELITTLQTRLDLPELGLFQVDGNNVSVRAGGVLTQLAAQSPGSSAQPGQYLPPEQRPTPGVRVVETEFVRRPPPQSTGERASVNEAVSRGRHDLAGMAHDMVNDAMRSQASAPPPRRGLSIQGRTTGGSMMPASPGSSRPAPPREAPAQASQNPPAAGQPSAQPPAQPPAQPSSAEPARQDDSASTRFNLLELD